MARTLVVCLLVAAMECVAQQVGGTIRGTIVDERTGRGIGGAKLYAVTLSPRVSSTAEVVAAADGAFVLAGVGAGTYRLCASAGGTYAPGCFWLDRTTDVTAVNWGQTVAGVVVRLKRGSKLSVRVDDTGGNLRRREVGKVIDMVLVLADARGNQQMLQATRVLPAFTEYETVIPEDAALTLTARAYGLAVVGDDGLEVGPDGKAYGFAHAAATPAGQRKSFRFQVTGAR